MLSLKLHRTILAGIDYLASEYKHGRLLYADVLKSRDMTCAAIEQRQGGIDRDEICKVFDREFEREYRAYASRHD